MYKLLRYNALRHMPGRIGSRYQRKYSRLHARTRQFQEALRYSQDMTCIDLGANVGEYTKIMASVAKRVIAFEPDPWSLAVLIANTAEIKNVSIEKAAAGTFEGKMPLYRHARFDENPSLYSHSSSLYSSKSNVSEEGAIEVDQIDFIHYLACLNEDIGIVKMDIEGAEVDVLEALLCRPEILKRIGYIFAETHESRIPSHENRLKYLREKIRDIARPRISLDWS